MTATEFKHRKTRLKRQYLQIAGLNRFEKIDKAILFKIRQRYETQMNKKFDPVLSKKLDCIQYLLEN